jgi:hypothetical protein
VPKLIDRCFFRSLDRAKARNVALPALALAMLAAADVWLAMHLADALGGLLAQLHAPLVPMLAAAGYAAMAGGGLILTWLSLEDLIAALRKDNLPSDGTKPKSGDYISQPAQPAKT